MSGLVARGMRVFVGICDYAIRSLWKEKPSGRVGLGCRGNACVCRSLLLLQQVSFDTYVDLF